MQVQFVTIQHNNIIVKNLETKRYIAIPGWQLLCWL